MRARIQDFFRTIVPACRTHVAKLPKAKPMVYVFSLLAPWIGSAQGIDTIIEAPGPHGVLRGVLLKAQGQSTMAAIIIPGSGPTDHDGNSILGVKAATYQYLAYGLAAAGISTVRIDKRGMYLSAGAVPDPNAVTVREYVTDIACWAEVLKRTLDAPCVWLIGHSEGALIALAAAGRSGPYCGVVSVAGTGLPVGQLLRQQIRANPTNAALLDDSMAAIDELESGRHIDTSILHPVLQQTFHPKTQGFLIDLFSYDPRELIRKVQVPVLILQGERDLQVSVDDARHLKAARPDAELMLLPDTNHVLKQVVSPDAGANLSTYADPDLPLAPGVVQAISRFMTKTSAGR